MTIIRLAAFHHEMLNLNGDVMNLLVLARRLNWLGFQVEVVDLDVSNTASELSKGLDFALVGHGSAAAWHSILSQPGAFAASVRLVCDANIPVLAIGSGFEQLVDHEIAPLKYQRGRRISKFEIVKWGEVELLGYLNTDTNLPPFLQLDNFYLTMLHGPLLSKNPALAEFIVNSILINRGLAVPEPKSPAFGLVDQVLANVWALERDLANE